MSGNNGGFSAREAAQLIYHQRSLITPTNTKRAYVEKGLEFLQFCDFEYKQEREFRRTINSDKLYKFLLFVAYRGKRQRGKKRTSGGDEKVFDEEEYKAVMDRIGDLIKIDRPTVRRVTTSWRPPQRVLRLVTALNYSASCS